MSEPRAARCASATRQRGDLAAAAAAAAALPTAARRGGALLPGHERLASEAALAVALATAPLTVLHAPRDAGRRFSYYFTEHAARHEPPPPPLNMKLRLSWDEFVRRLRAPPTEGAVYAQVDLATREGTALRALAKDRADMRAGMSAICSSCSRRRPRAADERPRSRSALGRLEAVCRAGGHAGALSPTGSIISSRRAVRKNIPLFLPDTSVASPADHCT